MILFIIVFLILGAAFFLSGFISGIIQYFKNPKPPDGLTIEQYKQWYDDKLWLQDNESNNDDVQLQERIMLLDETIVKYNKLLDNLTEQYNFTMDEKKRSVILSKQIITLEKLNRALEKREKLDN